ncbi:carbamoylphosphate synthase large subunit [Xylaria cf. heliscus]|nr:carbamoylphosphate synthase large subunit [Xylaria cf. heliscus]
MATRNGTARCFSLVFLSFFIFPISLAILCFLALKHHTIQHGTSRIILVTGVGMAKGLTLARAFHLSGHRVIGADFEEYIIPCSGRVSKSLSSFYRLPKPSNPTQARAYTDLLVQIIKDEKVELWDARAKEAIEKRTSCRCVQFDVSTTSMLHEKNTFMRACAERDLPIPDTHEVTSRGEVLCVLSCSSLLYPGRKYILKPVGMADVNRGDMTLLPLSSHLKTREYVSRLYISTSTPWILQQFIPGGEEYCTHALIVRGKLKCFVACPSAELLVYYAPLPRDDALWRAMRDFTVEFLERSPRAGSMTGHLSFDFIVSSGLPREKGGRYGRSVYAIECNPRAHTAVVLFAQQGPEMRDMVQAYLSIIERPENASINAKAFHKQQLASGDTLITPPATLQPRYWIGHDIVSLIFKPLLRLGVGLIGFREFSKSGLIFLTHLVTWKEGSFETWDPLPALVLYHVYWPLTIVSAWCQGRRWSRINVSTTKMFTC